jgi:hypothetical protein
MPLGMQCQVVPPRRRNNEFGTRELPRVGQPLAGLRNPNRNRQSENVGDRTDQLRTLICANMSAKRSIKRRQSAPVEARRKKIPAVVLEEFTPLEFAKMLNFDVLRKRSQEHALNEARGKQF